MYLSGKPSTIYKRHLVSEGLLLIPLKVKAQQVVYGMSGCWCTSVSLRAGPAVWAGAFGFGQTWAAAGWHSGHLGGAETISSNSLSPNKTRHKQMSTASPFLLKCKTVIYIYMYKITHFQYQNLYVLWAISRFSRFNWGKPLPQSPLLLIFPSTLSSSYLSDCEIFEEETVFICVLYNTQHI